MQRRNSHFRSIANESERLRGSGEQQRNEGGEDEAEIQPCEQCRQSGLP